MIALLNYGAGNVGSVLKAVQHLGCSAEVIDKPESLRAAEKVIFPGQGHFGSMMRALEERRLLNPLRDLLAGGTWGSVWASKRSTKPVMKRRKLPGLPCSPAAWPASKESSKFHMSAGANSRFAAAAGFSEGLPTAVSFTIATLTTGRLPKKVRQ